MLALDQRVARRVVHRSKVKLARVPTGKHGTPDWNPGNPTPEQVEKRKTDPLWMYHRGLIKNRNRELYPNSTAIIPEFVTPNPQSAIVSNLNFEAHPLQQMPEGLEGTDVYSSAHPGTHSPAEHLGWYYENRSPGDVSIARPSGNTHYYQTPQYRANTVLNQLLRYSKIGDPYRMWAASISGGNRHAIPHLVALLRQRDNPAGWWNGWSDLHRRMEREQGDLQPHQVAERIHRIMSAIAGDPDSRMNEDVRSLWEGGHKAATGATVSRVGESLRNSGDFYPYHIMTDAMQDAGMEPHWPALVKSELSNVLSEARMKPKGNRRFKRGFSTKRPKRKRTISRKMVLPDWATSGSEGGSCSYARSNREDLQSWMDPSGKVHPTWGTGSHQNWLDQNRHLFPNKKPGEFLIHHAFGLGWQRLGTIGDELWSHNPVSPPNERQKSKLVEMATDHNLSDVIHDNEEQHRTLWSNRDQLSRRYARGSESALLAELRLVDQQVLDYVRSHRVLPRQLVDLAISLREQLSREGYDVALLPLQYRRGAKRRYAITEQQWAALPARPTGETIGRAVHQAQRIKGPTAHEHMANFFDANGMPHHAAAMRILMGRESGNPVVAQDHARLHKTWVLQSPEVTSEEMENGAPSKYGTWFGFRDLGKSHDHDLGTTIDFRHHPHAPGHPAVARIHVDVPGVTHDALSSHMRAPSWSNDDLNRGNYFTDDPEHIRGLMNEAEQRHVRSNASSKKVTNAALAAMDQHKRVRDMDALPQSERMSRRGQIYRPVRYAHNDVENENIGQQHTRKAGVGEIKGPIGIPEPSLSIENRLPILVEQARHITGTTGKKASIFVQYHGKKVVGYSLDYHKHEPFPGIKPGTHFVLHSTWENGRPTVGRGNVEKMSRILRYAQGEAPFAEPLPHDLQGTTPAYKIREGKFATAPSLTSMAKMTGGKPKPQVSRRTPFRDDARTINDAPFHRHIPIRGKDLRSAYEVHMALRPMQEGNAVREAMRYAGVPIDHPTLGNETYIRHIEAMANHLRTDPLSPESENYIAAANKAGSNFGDIELAGKLPGQVRGRYLPPRSEQAFDHGSMVKAAHELLAKAREKHGWLKLYDKMAAKPAETKTTEPYTDIDTDTLSGSSSPTVQIPPSVAPAKKPVSGGLFDYRSVVQPAPAKQKPLKLAPLPGENARKVKPMSVEQFRNYVEDKSVSPIEAASRKRLGDWAMRHGIPPEAAMSRKGLLEWMHGAGGGTLPAEIATKILADHPSFGISPKEASAVWSRFVKNKAKVRRSRVLYSRISQILAR